MGVYGIVFACGRCGGALDSTAHMCSSVIFVWFHIKKKSERERGKMEAETNTTHIFAYSPLQRYIVCTVFLLITVAFNGVFSSHHLLCGCLPFLQFISFHFHTIQFHSLAPSIHVCPLMQCDVCGTHTLLLEMLFHKNGEVPQCPLSLDVFFTYINHHSISCYHDFRMTVKHSK